MWPKTWHHQTLLEKPEAAGQGIQRRGRGGAIFFRVSGGFFLIRCFLLRALNMHKLWGKNPFYHSPQFGEMGENGGKWG